MQKFEPGGRSHCALSGHARPPHVPRSPGADRPQKEKACAVLPSCCPLRGRRSKRTPVCTGHATCSRVRNESIPHGHTVVVSERRQLGHQGFERLSPRLRRRVHAAPVWALRRVSAPCQPHGAGTPCARPPRSASSPAHGGTAGLHRRCGSSGLRAASAGTLGVTVESPVCVMRRRKRRTCL